MEILNKHFTISSEKPVGIHDPKFSSSVILNGIRYVSSRSDFRKRKAAKHAAAQVAVKALGLVPNLLV